MSPFDRIKSNSFISDASIEEYSHETPLPDSLERPHCLKICCHDQTFFLASNDDHAVAAVWFPRLKEIAGCGDIQLEVVSLFISFKTANSIHNTSFSS